MPLFPAYAQPAVKNEQAGSEEAPWSLGSNVPINVTQQSSEVSVTYEKLPCEKPAAKSSEEEESEESSEDEEMKRKHKKQKEKKQKDLKHRSRKEEKKKKKKKHRSRSRERKEKKKHAHRVHSPPHDKTDEVPLIAKGIVFSNGLNLRPSQAFYVDSKGDKNNLAFPNLYYKYVPRYIPALGTLGGKHISKAKKVKKQKPPRYFGKRAIKRISKAPIPVKQDVPSERNPLGIYDSSTIMYIQGLSTVETQDHPATNSEEDLMKKRNAEYNQRLKQEPHNIKLWMEFIDFQETPEAQRLVTNEIHTASKEKQLKTLHRRALLERKVSILDKAIELNPKCAELITTKLQIASEYWEAGQLQQEWKRVLFILPMSVVLWEKYLSFTENYFEGFSVNNVLKAYSSCIQKMLQMQHPSFSSHQRPAKLEEHMIDIATRLCLFLRQSGWTEKSTSVFQALIELGLNRLQKFHQSKENLRNMLPELQSFWDSGAPRFGEDKSDVQGSNQYRLIHGTDLSDTEDGIVQSGQPHPVVWVRVERLRSHEQWQAWSAIPDIDDECDDPERNVSFGDISPYIFALEKNSSVNFRLVTGFLQTLGVPLYPAVQAQTFWAPMARAEDLNYLVPNVPSFMRLESVAPNLLNSGTYLNWIRQIVLNAFALLPAPYKMELALWWLHVERMRMAVIVGQPNAGYASSWKETKRWIKNFLKGIPPLDVISTLLLYSGYACVEWDCGNQEESSRVLQMVLTMHSLNPFVQQTDDRKRDALIHTWLFLVNQLIRANVRDKALAHLVTLGAGMPFNPQAPAPTPALLLKAKRKYESLFQQILNEPESFNGPYESNMGLFNHPDFVVDFLACYSCFLSLTEGCVPAYKSVMHWLERHQSDNMELSSGRRFDQQALRYHSRREMIYANLLRLLSLCPAWARDVQPRLHHDMLFTSLSEYPKSFQLLSIFIESEEQCSSFSRLWNFLIGTAKSKAEDSTIVAVAACLALAKRGKLIYEAEERSWRQSANTDSLAVHPGYLNKIYHLIEHCVAQYPGRHSPLLWRILMRLAHLKKDWQSCKALFYRAARDCPWAKDIFMDVVDYVPSLVKEVAGLLSEKDLRLRFPLEELDVLLEPEPDLEVAEAGETENLGSDEAAERLGNDAEELGSDGSDDNLSEDYENDADSDV